MHDETLASLLDTGTSTGTPAGCGRLGRDELELAAIARTDRSVPIDDLACAHLMICRRCIAAVDHFDREHRLLSELARASKGAETSWRHRVVVDEAGEIAGYRLGREIHRGGQGAIYLAEQLATRRQCAVKMLLGGRFATDVQRARFEREVEVVAGLRHPSIVTLYESGISTGGEPWFAMEYVEGERLDEFVRRTGPKPRDIADLVRRIADAIAYAHRRGVIHRDLKPGNILIDEDGAPRILDFGLARLSVAIDPADPSSGTTLAGEFAGTFAYAAPEQLSGDPSLIDSRCDLYALGVLLYELLVGSRPFDGAKSVGELVARKSAGPPRRPSSVGRADGLRIDADLDAIVLRLLSPDPARRYDTATALAEDLSRYLDGRPILAREDSRAYVIAKTLRRHWLATAVAMGFVATIAGSAVTLGVLYSRAEESRALALTEQRRVERAYAAFRSALASANPEDGQGSSNLSVRDFLGLVEHEVRAELVDEPEVLAEMLQTVGLIQLGFEEPERSRGAITAAYDLFLESHRAGRVTDRQMAAAEIAMARQLFHDGEAIRGLSRAEASYRRAIELLRASNGPNAVETIDAERQLATVLRAQKRYGEADAILSEALVHAKDFSDKKDGALVRAGILNGRAALAVDQGDNEAAMEAFRETLHELARIVPANDYRRGRTLALLAQAELRSGRLDEASVHAEEAVRILGERKGPDAPWTKDAAATLAAIESARASGD